MLTPRQLVWILVGAVILSIAVSVLLTGCTTAPTHLPDTGNGMVPYAAQSPPLPFAPGLAPKVMAMSIGNVVPPPGLLTVAWDGSPGFGSYLVQGSSNLLTWQTLTNVPADRTNYQVMVPGYPLQFFRCAVQYGQ